MCRKKRLEKYISSKKMKNSYRLFCDFCNFFNLLVSYKEIPGNKSPRGRRK